MRGRWRPRRGISSAKIAVGPSQILNEISRASPLLDAERSQTRVRHFPMVCTVSCGAADAARAIVFTVLDQQRGKQVMERIELLREQAAILRSLAHSFDVQTIREQLLDVAGHCEELAKSVAQNPRGVDVSAPDFLPDLQKVGRSVGDLEARGAVAAPRSPR